MRPRTCGSESVVCPMGDTVAPSDAQTLSSPTSQPSLGVRARGPLCLPCRDALGAQMTPRLKPRRAPSSFPPAPPGATRSLPASPTVTRRHPVSPGVTQPPPGPIQPRGSLGEVRRGASARKPPDGRGVAAWDPPLTKAALCPAAAPESCFSPGRPPRLSRCLPARSGPAPITSLRTVGLCAPRGSGYRGGGRALGAVPCGGREGGRGSARTRVRGECLGNPLPLLVLKVLPRKLLVPDVRLSGGKGPGGSLYAPPWGRVLLLGLAQAGRSLRRFSSAPGASPCDASRASCSPRPGWAACDFGV